MHDGRCPICRDSPYNHPDDEDDDYSEEGSYVSFYSEALKKGREAAKTDKSTARIMKTIKKWKTERTIAKREMKESWKKIEPLEKKVEQKIDDFENKERAKFNEKHAKLLLEHKENHKKRLKAGTQHRAAQMRMAVKHGFVRMRRSSYRRSSRWTADDVQEMM